jgi:hypothetical protein
MVRPEAKETAENAAESEGMTEEVILSKLEFDTLYKSVELLKALFAAGVDNWEGYDEAVASVTEADHG